MKIVTTADWHYRNTDSYGVYNSSGVNDFLLNRVDISMEIVNKVRNLDAHLLIAGDFIDDRIVDSITLHYSSYIISMFNHLRATILLEGNHGFDGKDNLYSIISHWKYLCPDNLYIVTEPKILEIDGVCYHCIPAINDVDKLFPEIMKDFIKQIKISKPNILVLHAPIVDAKFDSGVKAKSGIKRDHIHTASNKYDYVVCGDFHRYQKLFHNTWYTGSPMQWSLRDKGQDKGFQIIDLDNNKVKFVKTSTHKFIEANWVIGEKICPLLKNPQNFKGTLKNSIVVIRLVKKFKQDEPPIEEVKKRLLDAGVKRIFVDKKTRATEKRRTSISSNMGIPEMIEAFVEQHKDSLPARRRRVIERGQKYLR